MTLTSRDHNATSYSTETTMKPVDFQKLESRDHNATSYSTETSTRRGAYLDGFQAEIITLRAIALKHVRILPWISCNEAEIITLRAIALKLYGQDIAELREEQRS